MPSADRTAAWGLVAAALVCALGNLWVAAERTTIPLALGFEIDGKVLLEEKHPGDDDTCLLRPRGHADLQVDRAVFDAVRVGDTISKRRFDGVLSTSHGPVALEWSRDLRGFSIVMPVALLIAAFLAWRLTRAQRRGGRSPAL